MRQVLLAGIVLKGLGVAAVIGWNPGATPAFVVWAALLSMTVVAGTLLLPRLLPRWPRLGRGARWTRSSLGPPREEQNPDRNVPGVEPAAPRE